MPWPDCMSSYELRIVLVACALPARRHGAANLNRRRTKMIFEQIEGDTTPSARPAQQGVRCLPLRKFQTASFIAWPAVSERCVRVST